MRMAGWSSLAMIRTYVGAQTDVLAADEFRRIFADAGDRCRNPGMTAPSSPTRQLGLTA